LTFSRPLQLRDVLVDPAVVAFYDGLQIPDIDEICPLLPPVA
jgi:hypothetical protein